MWTTINVYAMEKIVIVGVDEYVKYGAVAMKNHVALTCMNVI